MGALRKLSLPQLICRIVAWCPHKLCSFSLYRAFCFPPHHPPCTASAFTLIACVTEHVDSKPEGQTCHITPWGINHLSQDQYQRTISSTEYRLDWQQRTIQKQHSKQSAQPLSIYHCTNTDSQTHSHSRHSLSYSRTNAYKYIYRLCMRMLLRTRGTMFVMWLNPSFPAWHLPFLSVTKTDISFKPKPVYHSFIYSQLISFYCRGLITDSFIETALYSSTT